MTVRLPFLLPLLLAVALLAACVRAPRAYSGPARPRERVARLVVFASGSTFGRATDTVFDGKVVAVDGTAVRTSLGYVDVLPGPHEVTVRWSRHGAFDPLAASFSGDDVPRMVPVDGGTVTFRVDAEAGLRYELRWPRDDQPGGPLGFEASRP